MSPGYPQHIQGSGHPGLLLGYPGYLVRPIYVQEQSRLGCVLLEQPYCLIHHHLHLDGRQCCSNVLFLLGDNQSSDSLIEERNNLDICRYHCTGSRLAFFSKSQCDSQSITQSKHEVSPYIFHILCIQLVYTTSKYRFSLVHTPSTYN